MRYKVNLLNLLFVLCLSSCAGMVDIDDLTTQDFSNVNYKKPYFSITLSLSAESKIIYAANITESTINEIEYEKTSEDYIVYVIPFASNKTDYVLADKVLTEELDYLFNNAIFSKSILNNDVLTKYLTSCLIYANKRYYSVDVMGHLLYYIGDYYYRSDLKVSIEDVYKHRFYIEELYYDKPIELTDETIFAYKNKSAPFSEVKDYLKSDGRHYQKNDLKTEKEREYVYATDINYKFFEESPVSEDFLLIGDSVKVNKEGMIYSSYNKYGVLGHYLNYITYEISAPMVVSGCVMGTFDNVFEYLESN